MHDPLPIEVRQPDWRGTRVACGSLVALRRRLSPALPLSRSLWKRAAPCRTAVSRLLHERNGRQHRSEEHTSELQSRLHLVCRLLLEKKKKTTQILNR